MSKALEILTNLLKQKYDDRPFVFGVEKAHIEIDNIHEAITELKAMQEENKILKHNYDVQVEYNNTAYKNYTNMVNSLEQRIEAMKPKTCEGCKTCEHYSSGKQSDNFGWEKCGWDWECKRKYEDRYELKATT